MPSEKSTLLHKKNLKTIPIGERKSLVTIKDFAQVPEPGSSFRAFLDRLPKFLAAKELIEFINHVKSAKDRKKPIIIGMGAHPVKVGLNPIIIALMKHGWISSIAINGAFMIHDFEIAIHGATSENVDENLHSGDFGNATETGDFINSAMKEGFDRNENTGQAIGKYLEKGEFPHIDDSVLVNAHRLQIPVTVHPAIGTDIIHYHPNFDGGVVGKLAERDFMQFATNISKIGNGGVYINIGSAVLMPEVFLKALAFCTGQGIKMKNFYTAVFDFVRHYRCQKNVTHRPVLNGGKGYYFIGHHEIMIPILATALIYQ